MCVVADHDRTDLSIGALPFLVSPLTDVPLPVNGHPNVHWGHLLKLQISLGVKFGVLILMCICKLNKFLRLLWIFRTRREYSTERKLTDHKFWTLGFWTPVPCKRFA